MVQWLSKISGCLLLVGCLSVTAQNGTGETSTNDYKDPKQHEKFNKRRNMVGAWQINQLKNGALVVRLKTNQMAIDELKKAGNSEMALQKEAESYVINKNTITAFRDKFDFCKVYFILSHQSDGLLEGKRADIFIDTTQQVSAGLAMNEKFYLIAERDYEYNSSIGFLPEDSARGVIERGSPVKQMAFVIKNKYGHQLKSPFPYYVSEKTYVGSGIEYPVMVTRQEGGANKIEYTVDKTYADSFDKSADAARPARPKGNLLVTIPKQFTYEKLALAVEQLNDELKRFHQATPAPSEDRIPEDARPFLY